MAHQAPLSLGFSRQEYWSGLPSPSPGDLPDPGIKPGASLGAQQVKNPPAKWEIWVQTLGWEDSLEKEKATHSTILTGESHGHTSLAGYSPRGWHRVEQTEPLSPSTSAAPPKLHSLKPPEGGTPRVTLLSVR